MTGERINRELQYRGITQDHIASAVGCKRQLVTFVVHRRYPANRGKSLAVKMEIQKRLGLPYREIWEEEPPPQSVAA